MSSPGNSCCGGSSRSGNARATAPPPYSDSGPRRTGTALSGTSLRRLLLPCQLREHDHCRVAPGGPETAFDRLAKARSYITKRGVIILFQKSPDLLIGDVGVVKRFEMVIPDRAGRGGECEQVVDSR